MLFRKLIWTIPFALLPLNCTSSIESERDVEEKAYPKPDLNLLHKVNDPPLLVSPENNPNIITLKSSLEYYGFENHNILKAKKAAIQAKASQLGLQQLEFPELQEEFEKKIVTKDDWSPEEIDLCLLLLEHFPERYTIELLTTFGLEHFDDPSIKEAIEFTKVFHQNIVEALRLQKINPRIAMQASKGIFTGFEKGDFEAINQYLHQLNQPTQNEVLPKAPLYFRPSWYLAPEEDMRQVKPPEYSLPPQIANRTAAQLSSGTDENASVIHAQDQRDNLGWQSYLIYMSN